MGNSWPRLAGLAQRASAGVFGESATVTIGAIAYNLAGEFDAAAIRERATDEGTVIADVAPRISILRANIADTAITPDTDTVAVRGVTYYVREVRPDGADSLVLILGR